mgnify:CR=1 FL=1
MLGVVVGVENFVVVVVHTLDFQTDGKTALMMKIAGYNLTFEILMMMMMMIVIDD